MTARPRSTLSAALAIAAKELREGLRDRQTVLYTFLLPVCLYPVLFWVMVQGALVVRGQQDAKDVRIALVADADAHDSASAALRRADEERAPIPLPGGGVLPPPGRVEIVDFAGRADDPEGDARTALEADEDLGAVLVVPPSRSDDDPATLYHDSTRSSSSIAKDRVRSRLGAWATKLRDDEAASRGVDPAALDPIEVRRRDLATDEEEGALALSLLLPMLLIVMAVMGSFFPAVDLTAGEKERRTAETTMLLPVPRASVQLGKILAVCASGMIATALNIVAIGLTAEHLLQQLGAGIEIELPFLALLQIAPLALLFAFFVSATLTGFAGRAASFKEGQALLGPVQMVFIFPAMAASMPGLELTLVTALIPIVNVALAVRELLIGHASLLPVLVTAAALSLYALLAIRVAVWMLTREGVALAGETLSLKKLTALLRSR